MSVKDIISRHLTPSDVCPVCFGDAKLTDCCSASLTTNTGGEQFCTECLGPVQKEDTHTCHYCDGTGYDPDLPPAELD